MKDLTGQRFGKLTVIKPTNKGSKNRCVIWQCKCDCGKIIEAATNYLNYGQIQSCGCARYKVDDLVGQKFGKLTVLELNKKRNSCNQTVWKCQCECGNIIDVAGVHLKSGATQSCGCVKSRGEQKIYKLLKDNDIDFVQQKSFKNCFFPDTKYLAKFDFYVNNKYLIEYDGEQHFFASNYGWNTEEKLIKTQQHDIYKNKWCKENNISLIRIPYTHLKDLCIKDLVLETSQFIV